MLKIETILCPTDFSECSQAALLVALDLARVLGARVQLTHVFQTPVYVGWEDSPAALTATTQFLEQARAQAVQHLNELRDSHVGDVPIETAQVDGAPQSKIVELAAHADLIVMGTHGRTGVSHLVLGSVAERVVRTAPCPVLTVPLKK